MKPQTHDRLELLNKYLAKWGGGRKNEQSFITQEVIEAIDRIGLKDVLADFGVVFVNTKCPVHNAKVNTQHFYRWLGKRAIDEQPEKLFYVEQAIVAAMPEQIRMDYLNEVYLNCGVVITLPQPATSTLGFTLSDAIKSVMKEEGEANVYVIDLLNSNDAEANKKAEREIEQAIVALQVMLASVKARNPIQNKVVN